MQNTNPVFGVSYDSAPGDVCGLAKEVRYEEKMGGLKYCLGEQLPIRTYAGVVRAQRLQWMTAVRWKKTMNSDKKSTEQYYI